MDYESLPKHLKRGIEKFKLSLDRMAMEVPADPLDRGDKLVQAINDFVENLNIEKAGRKVVWAELADHYHDELVPRAGRERPRDPTSQSSELDKIAEGGLKFQDAWRVFLKEGKKKKLNENSGDSMIDDAVLGEYIAEHSEDGDPHEALSHLSDEIREMEELREALNDLIADQNRGEINDMMDDEKREIQFAKDNPEYTTRNYGDL